jgi:hypothetical protein
MQWHENTCVPFISSPSLKPSKVEACPVDSVNAIEAPRLQPLVGSRRNRNRWFLSLSVGAVSATTVWFCQDPPNVFRSGMLPANSPAFWQCFIAQVEWAFIVIMHLLAYEQWPPLTAYRDARLANSFCFGVSAFFLTLLGCYGWRAILEAFFPDLHKFFVGDRKRRDSANCSTPLGS